MVDVMVTVVVVMDIPKVNAKSTSRGRRQNECRLHVRHDGHRDVIIVMVMLGADKSRRPERRQGNRHDL